MCTKLYSKIVIFPSTPYISLNGQQSDIDCSNLISILKKDAKLVLPVGGSDQQLNVIKKCENDEVEESLHDEVSFVPMLAGKSDDGNDV